MVSPMARHIVVMGVAGSGKSTVARAVSAATGFRFAEADEFHSSRAVARMRAGVPLGDADREPWLRSLAAWIAARDAEGQSTVLACSALRRRYRDILISAAATVAFVHLDGPADLLRERVAQRADHYMPVSLVESQLDTLEPLRADEAGVVFEASRSPDDLVGAIIRSLDLPDSRDFTSVR